MKMTLLTKQMRKTTKTVFFQNDPDEEKSDSEENQEYLNKNDKPDIEFDSDVDTEEGFPVKKLLQKKMLVPYRLQFWILKYK